MAVVQKTCKRCGRQYTPHRYNSSVCTECRTGRPAQWYQETKAERQQVAKLNTRRIKQSALEAYGSTCQCCGESTFEFLSIDHINNDGAQHRKEIGQGSLYWWLKRNNYPEGFQVLCMNCNTAKGLYGACPHAA